MTERVCKCGVPLDLCNPWPCSPEYKAQLKGFAEWVIDSALAAAARQSGDVKQAPGEAPQSGPKGNAQ